MIIGEPPRSPADVQFQLGAFPIRITPFFWVVAGLLTYRSVAGDPRGVLISVVALLFSILIHELGHGLAFQRCGLASRIVLYHFGGLAIPTGTSNYGATGLTHGQQIYISIAGPVAQFLGAIVVCGLVLATGHYALVDTWITYLGFELPARLLQRDLAPLPRVANTFVGQFAYVSIYWAILNLFPIYPLDGGQIARELFLLRRNSHALRNSLVLSLGCAAAVAALSLMRGDTYMAMLFGMLAYSSYMSLQSVIGNQRNFYE